MFLWHRNITFRTLLFYLWWKGSNGTTIKNTTFKFYVMKLRKLYDGRYEVYKRYFFTYEKIIFTGTLEEIIFLFPDALKKQ